MQSTPTKIFIYETAEGRHPYLDWLSGLKDRKAAGVVKARLNRVRLGNFGDCKAVGEGVFEFRIDFGPGYRIYFGREDKQIVILLCGGDKKTQVRDIKKAIEYWSDYRRRPNG
ncbi:MAG: type II toxin-antitoxin system RelE/ParE family toxin [Candidatus Brocadia sp.]|nr:MAG: type II toxin-antitoxin system RelE/ParE family toxin [Candidatus Brocadia sp.]